MASFDPISALIGGALIGFASVLLMLTGRIAGISGIMTGCFGVCGIARLSSRSIVATATFMATAMVVVAVMRHGLGG